MTPTPEQVEEAKKLFKMTFQAGGTVDSIAQFLSDRDSKRDEVEANLRSLFEWDGEARADLNAKLRAARVESKAFARAMMTWWDETLAAKGRAEAAEALVAELRKELKKSELWGHELADRLASLAGLTPANLGSNASAQMVYAQISQQQRRAEQAESISEARRQALLSKSDECRIEWTRAEIAEAALADSERCRGNQVTAIRSIMVVLGNPDPVDVMARLEKLIGVEADLAAMTKEMERQKRIAWENGDANRIACLNWERVKTDLAERTRERDAAMEMYRQSMPAMNKDLETCRQWLLKKETELAKLRETVGEEEVREDLGILETDPGSASAHPPQAYIESARRLARALRSKTAQVIQLEAKCIAGDTALKEAEAKIAAMEKKS